MKTRSINELLFLVLYCIRNPRNVYPYRDEPAPCLCSLIKRMDHDIKDLDTEPLNISEIELLRDYVIHNKPKRRWWNWWYVSESLDKIYYYYWPKYWIWPRVIWLRKHIALTKPKNS